MPDHTKKEITEAITAALLPLSAGSGGYLRRLDAYKGELSASSLFPEAVQLPALFISFAGSSFSQGPYMGSVETLTFNVIAVARPGAEKDAFAVLADARASLCGATLGLDLRPIRLTREFPLASDSRTEAACAVYTITQTVSLPAQE